MKQLQQTFDFKIFLKFTIPLTLQMLLKNIVGITDNFMVGTLGSDYMSALKIATTYFFFFTILLSAFVNAGAIIASQLWGRGEIEEYRKTCSVVLFLSMVISTFLALLTFLYSKELIAIMIKDEPTIVAYGSTYLKITAFTLVLTGFNIALTVSFTSAGNTKIPFYQQLVIAIANVILNYILIYGKFGFPALGVAGAALASFIATLLGCTVLVYYSIKNRFLSFTALIKPQMAKIREIMKLGFPMLGDMFFWQLTLIIYLKLIGLGGKNDVAIYGVVGIFFSILFLFVSGFTSGNAIIVGQLIGRGLKQNAYDFAKKALKASLIVTIFPSLLTLLITPIIPSMFKLDSSLFATTFICMVLLVIKQPFAVINAIIPNTIRAGKDTLFPLFISIIPFVFLSFPIAAIFGNGIFHFGIVAIFFAMLIEEIAKSIIYALRFKSKRWLHKSDHPVTAIDYT